MSWDDYDEYDGRDDAGERNAFADYEEDADRRKYGNRADRRAYGRSADRREDWAIGDSWGREEKKRGKGSASGRRPAVKKRRRVSPAVVALSLVVVALSGVIAVLALRLHQLTALTAPAAAESAETRTAGPGVDPESEEFWNGAPELDVQLLTPNEYSRPQIPLSRITGIVIHYTANPGSTAQENRDYFEGLKDGASGTKVSSHFVIGIDGEIIQCIPSSEIAYCSNSANDYTLSIECCHPDESGEFTRATYDSLVKLTGWLSHVFGVERGGIIRHYDVTGKICPKYFVDHEDAWEQFRDDAVAYRDSI